MTTKQKQWQLYFLGFDSAMPGHDWNSHSTAATKKFQRESGLDADGIFGPLTEESSRQVIREIQKIVTKYNPMPLEIDGLAGRYTMAATIRYQKEMGLTPDGIAGAATRQKMAQRAGDWWDEIRYFNREEFQCKCGRYCDGYPAQMQRAVVEVADRARAYFGAPGTVVSGLRCSTHNENVGGVSNSRHLTGKATDLRISGVSAAQLLEYVKQQPETRYAYAINQTNVHFDIL